MKHLVFWIFMGILQGSGVIKVFKGIRFKEEEVNLLKMDKYRFYLLEVDDKDVVTISLYEIAQEIAEEDSQKEELFEPNFSNSLKSTDYRLLQETKFQLKEIKIVNSSKENNSDISSADFSNKTNEGTRTDEPSKKKDDSNKTEDANYSEDQYKILESLFEKTEISKLREFFNNNDDKLKIPMIFLCNNQVNQKVNLLKEKFLTTFYNAKEKYKNLIMINNSGNPFKEEIIFDFNAKKLMIYFNLLFLKRGFLIHYRYSISDFQFYLMIIQETSFVKPVEIPSSSDNENTNPANSETPQERKTRFLVPLFILIDHNIAEIKKEKIEELNFECLDDLIYELNIMQDIFKKFDNFFKNNKDGQTLCDEPNQTDYQLELANLHSNSSNLKNKSLFIKLVSDKEKYDTYFLSYCEENKMFESLEMDALDLLEEVLNSESSKKHYTFTSKNFLKRTKNNEHFKVAGRDKILNFISKSLEILQNITLALGKFRDYFKDNNLLEKKLTILKSCNEQLCKHIISNVIVGIFDD